MDVHFDVFQAESGDPSIRVKIGDQPTVLLHSAKDPRREAAEFISAFDVEHAGIVVILGHGLGYHVHEVLNRVPEGTFVLTIDRFHPLLKVAAAVLPPPKRKGVTFMATTHLGQMQEAVFYQSSKLVRGGIVFIEHPASVRLSPDFYKATMEHLREVMNVVFLNAKTIHARGRHFLANFAANLPMMAQDPPVSLLEGALQGHPAIVVASGPSLKKNIHLLKEVKGRIPIIAAGSAYEALLNSGIVPDFAVAIDPMPENLPHFEGRGRKDVCFCWASQVYPPVPACFPGPRFVSISPHPLGQWFTEQTGKSGYLEISGTVTYSAVSLAAIMKADPIILIGLDLAVTGGYSHAPGLLACSEKVAVDGGTAANPDLLEVPAADGGTVLTTHSLMGFITTMNGLFRQLKAKGLTLIDATEGGALKAHTTVMTLRDALDHHSDNPVDAFALASDLHADYQLDETGRRRLIAGLEHLHRRLLNLYSKLDKAAVAIMTIRTLQQRFESMDSSRIQAKIGQDIKKHFDQFYRLNQEIARQEDLIRYFHDGLFFLRFGRKPVNPTVEEKIDFNGIYYVEMLRMLDQLIPLFHQSLSLLSKSGHPQGEAVGTNES